MSLYRNLIDTIKKQIEEDVLTAGTRLPSILALCRLYNVSSSTVRLALKELVDLGYLQSQPGSGFFVTRNARPARAALMGEKAIAIIVPSSDNSFYSDIVRGAAAACRHRGYHLVLCYSSDDPQIEAEELREVADKVAGLLIAPAGGQGSSRYVGLVERQIPFVFMDCYVEGLTAPLVATDNEAGGYMATKHLIEIGRRRIFAISQRQYTSLEERLNGYRRALKEYKIDYDPTLIRKCDALHEEAGYTLTTELLKNTHISEPVGLFAGEDSIARGCYSACREANLRIPQDIAIVGFDDYYALYLDPPMTTVRQDPFGIGSEATRILFDMIQPSEKPAPRSVRLRPEIILRGSSLDTACHNISEFTSRAQDRRRRIETLATGTARR